MQRRAEPGGCRPVTTRDAQIADRIRPHPVRPQPGPRGHDLRGEIQGDQHPRGASHPHGQRSPGGCGRSHDAHPSVPYRLTEWIVDNLRGRLDDVAMAPLTTIPVADSEGRAARG
ncbi:hypothetical protein Rhow_005150 [Rhodococcus wratislaviensis]|uniref:Uncharacterized protein n=1 Tax=Rhodococcus wratislaviensis TaxID=44752 RepID=A0A402CD14_RHOWR|nr:hypothetical protein Rhow_005150 [Rhodococcus wratislaviensis]